jgi:hypothetical protein
MRSAARRSTKELDRSARPKRGRDAPVVVRDEIEGVPVVGLASSSAMTRVGVADGLGGLVMRLVVGGRDWLHRNRAIDLDARLDGRALSRPRSTAYVDRGDVGLGDTCILTVASDRISLPSGDRVTLPDHGYAWFQRPDRVKTEVVQTRTGRALVTRWRIDQPPFRFELSRSIAIEPDERLLVQLTLANRGDASLPWFWSSHDMLSLDEKTEILLPEGERIVVYASHGFEAASGVSHAWPRIGLDDGRTIDLSKPARARRTLKRDFACKLFTKNPTGPLGVKEEDDVLWLEGPGTRAAIWINYGGWAPNRISARGVRYQNICAERALGGASDRVSHGVASGATAWIGHGERRFWSMRYGSRLAGDEL